MKMEMIESPDSAAGPVHDGNVIAALENAFAVIEFDLSVTILRANPNFLHAMGYKEHEIVGRHHSIFCTRTKGASAAYRQFWHQ